jgi:hypothetical protein
MSRFTLIVVFLLSISAWNGRAYAQGGATGAITGTVRDSSGAVIPGAEVRIISSGTDSVVRTVVTGAEGIFNAQLLPAGSYSLKIRAQGFADVSDRISSRLLLPREVSHSGA